MKTTIMLVSYVVLLSACDRAQQPVARQLAMGEARGAQDAVVLEEGVEIVGEPAELIWLDVPEFHPAADEDGDGFATDVDVDDRDPFTHPGARDEPCDGVDQDDDGTDYCPPDADGDGIVETADCNDLDPTISPMAREVPCNGVDENCNGIDDCDTDRDGVQDDVDADPRDREVR